VQIRKSDNLRNACAKILAKYGLIMAFGSSLGSANHINATRQARLKAAAKRRL
jgi:hypothetical protein